MASRPTEATQITIVIEQYSNSHRNYINRALQYVSIPLLTFGILGIIWAVPFPYFAFLGKSNGFVNWASFLIAFSIYYYYRLSPVVSYGILLVVFAFSAAIVGLEKLHHYGWLAMDIVCLIILAIGMLLKFIGYKYEESKQPTLSIMFMELLNGPVWLMYLILKKAGYKG